MVFVKQALLFVVIFFLLDRAFGLLLKPAYDANIEEFFRRYDTVAHDNIDADIIFTGDSQAHHGVDPLLIGKLCSCRAENLSMDGMNMITTWFVIREHLRNNVPPRIAVVQSSILQNAKFDRDGEQYVLLYERMPFQDMVEYVWLSRDTRFLIKELVETYRYRSAFARFLQLGPALPALHQSQNGYDPLVGHREGQRIGVPSINNAAGSPEHAMYTDPVQTIYLRKVMDLLRQNRVATVLVQPPMVAGTAPGSHRDKAAFGSMMNDIAEEYHAAYYDFNLPAYAAIQDQNYFYDGSHLNTEGARVYGAHLWDLVRGYMK